MSDTWRFQGKGSRVWSGLILCLVAWLAYIGGRELKKILTGPTSEKQEAVAMPIGWELQAIFVSSSDCIGNTAQGFAAAVRQAKTVLRERADSADVSFSTIGVAKDWDIQEGYEYLMLDTWSGPSADLDLDFGPWDEVSVGRNWGNTIISRYVEQMGGACRHESERGLLVPQLVLAKRFATDWREDYHFTFRKHEVLFRLCGAQRIIEWAEEGAPVEGLGEMSTDTNEYVTTHR